MSRTNKTGRSKGNGRFVQLTHFLMATAAWRSLTPADRSVYIALRQCYNGANNGSIGLGARRAADLAGVSKNTACKSFARLVERGFTECVTPGGFSTNSRRQTEWRLTDERCDVSGMKGSHAFTRWKPDDCKTKSQSRDAQVPIEGQLAGQKAATVPELGPKPRQEAA